MHRKANGGRHLTFSQFLVDQGPGKTAESTTSILFRSCHAHQAQFGHLRVDLAREVVILVPCSGIGGDFAFGEATYHVAYL